MVFGDLLVVAAEERLFSLVAPVAVLLDVLDAGCNILRGTVVAVLGTNLIPDHVANLETLVENDESVKMMVAVSVVFLADWHVLDVSFESIVLKDEVEEVLFGHLVVGIGEKHVLGVGVTSVRCGQDRRKVVSFAIRSSWGTRYDDRGRIAMGACISRSLGRRGTLLGMLMQVGQQVLLASW